METPLLVDTIVGAVIVLLLVFVSLAANRREDVEGEMRSLTRRRKK